MTTARTLLILLMLSTEKRMNRRERIPVIIVSILLVFFVILITLQEWLPVINIIFILAPFAVVWMVYNVIRHGEYKGRELDKEEEWGYADREKPYSVVRDDI